MTRFLVNGSKVVARGIKWLLEYYSALRLFSSPSLVRYALFGSVAFFQSRIGSTFCVFVAAQRFHISLKVF